MKMSTRVGWLCCGLGLALGANQARAQADPPKAQPAPKAKAEAPKANAAGADATFVREAATAGMAEVELGRLGVQKATRAEVKSFAQMMVDDHGKANQELESLASGKQLTVPGEPKPDQKAEKARLEKLSGASFDDAFMKTMAKDHQKAVGLFSKQASSGSDAELKSWAQQKLPTIKEHLAKAQELANGKAAAGAKHEHN
jgi:putative membrane protein